MRLSRSIILRFDRFRFDVGNARLEDERGPLHLNPKAFGVLGVLVERRGELVSKDQLLDAVWPDTHVADGVLKVSMAEIRAVLGDSATKPRFVETIYGRGYRFIADVAEVASADNVVVDDDGVPAQRSAQVWPAVDGSRRHSPGVLVGRARELELLEDHLALALRGDRQIVFVNGEPGAGKTSLVEHFVARVARTHVVAATGGQCLEHFGPAEAYMPVLEAVGRLVRNDGPTRMLLRRYAPTWFAQLPWLVEEDDRERLGRELVSAARDRMLREMGEFVEALGTDMPLVLVIEDLHWSDPSTIDLLSLLAARPEPARLLVIGTYRPVELILRRHPLRDVALRLVASQRAREVHIEDLGVEGVEEYLHVRFPAGRFPSELAKRFHERTDGNPLFLVTLVDHLLARGVIVARDDGWDLTEGLREELAAVPESLRRLIEQQLARLTAKDREVLCAASLVGIEFSAVAAAAGAGRPTAEVEKRCSRLAGAGRFLRDAGTAVWPDGSVTRSYVFCHALHRETLAASVPPAQRSAVHLRIGTALERGYGDRSSEVAGELALHFEHGADALSAARYHRLAAETSGRRYAFAEAEAHLESGLALLCGVRACAERDREELLLQSTLGPVLRATRGYAAPDVERALMRALELSESMSHEPPAFGVLWALWSSYNLRAELDRALEVAERNRAIAEASDDRLLRLEAHHALWVTHFFRGDLTAALHHLDAGEALYDPKQDSWSAVVYAHDPKTDALCHRALVLWQLGRADQAMATSLQAVEHARSVGHPLSVAHAIDCAAWVRFLRRELQPSRELSEALNAYVDEHGLPHWKPHALQMHGWAIAGQGELEHGIVEMEQGLALFTALGNRLMLSVYCAHLAAAKLRAGSLGEARATLEWCKALVKVNGERFHEPEIHRIDAELVLAEAGGVDSAPADARERAERLLHEAIECARRHGAVMFELRATTTLVRVCKRGPKRRQARIQLTDLLARFTEGFDTGDLQDARRLLGD